MRKNGVHKRKEITWSFLFRWTPGGEPELYAPIEGEENGDGKGNLVPWWITGDSEEAATGPILQDISLRDEDRLFPPNALGLSIIAKHIARDAFIKELTPAGMLSRSWYCRACGKLNKMGWLAKYPCSSCSLQVVLSQCFNRVLLTIILARGSSTTTH